MSDLSMELKSAGRFRVSSAVAPTAAVISACAAVASLTVPAAAQWDQVEIGVTQLTDSIYMLTGRGGNIGLCVGDDGAFLIDDQFAPLTEKIVAAVAEVTDKPIEFVVNTHRHGDHTGGNENLGEEGSIIVAHENVRRRMSADQINTLSGEVDPAKSPASLPKLTFTEAVTFHWNGEEIHVFHAPHAHTDGDSIVHFKNSNVIHGGDVLFNELYPFVDTNSGGTVEGILAATDKILALSDEGTQIIPGHGPLMDRAALVHYKNVVSTLRDRILAEIREGKSLEDVDPMAICEGYDETWGGKFLDAETFVRICFNDLNRTSGMK